MKIISAEERLKQQTGVKMAIFGPFGVGKTSLNLLRKERYL
jgi:replication-associated recombination protein RarA